MAVLLLILKRVVVFAVGAVLAWFVAFKLFPFVDDRMPVVIAALLTYCVVAYVLLPAFMRFWQFVHRPTHVPTRTHAADGWAVDPINIVVLAKTETEFIWAMQKAGWIKADPASPTTVARMIFSVILNRPYPSAPFGNYYVFGRKQDMGFQIPIGNSPRHRHHVRFWRLGTTSLEAEHEHYGFWRTLLHQFLRQKKEIWVGAAVVDRGLNIRLRTLQLDHKIERDTGIEREFLVKTLEAAHVLKETADIKAGEPLHTRHQGLGEVIIADGYVKLCQLKRQFLPPANQ